MYLALGIDLYVSVSKVQIPSFQGQNAGGQEHDDARVELRDQLCLDVSVGGPAIPHPNFCP